ncbi:MAG: cell division protein ZapA [Aerococcaceae bacterium]|nr:cell division protein ZapA [Aerococcaceae bacterium]
MEKRRYKALIAGQTYTIVGSRSEQHLDAVTALVNQQLHQLGELAPELSVADRCVLMALNAVSDQLVQEQRIVELEQQLQAQSSSQEVAPTNPRKKGEQVPFSRER